MPKQRGRPATGRSYYVLATSCGTLAVAAVVSAVYPAAGAATVPVADRAPTVFWDEYWGDVDESAPIGGPLEIPTIGEVLHDYDERYAALEAARPDEDDDAPVAPATDQFIPGLSDWGEPAGNHPGPSLPAVGPAGPTTPLAPGTPPPPVTTPTTTPPAATPPTTTPPTTTPPAATPPTTTPPTTSPPTTSPPTSTPSTSTPPTSTPPVVGPPSETPPGTSTPAPSTPPPPVVEPPADENLVLGERYDHLAADGTVLFSVTLVGVDSVLACTSAGTVPPVNGHLIGLQVAMAPAGAAAPPVRASDFRFLAGGVVTADVATDSATACQAEIPAAIVVLDVPAPTGTVVYRPDSWPAGLRWQL